MARTEPDVRADLNYQAAQMKGTEERFSLLKHWFPEVDRQGQYFVAAGGDASRRPKRCGSMEWRCKAVLANHHPDIEHRGWWVHAYDNYYDLLNLYAHPAVGYDDSLRSEPERLLDLARQQVGIRLNFHLFVLPSLRAIFREPWSGLLEREANLLEVHERTTKQAMAYMMAVDQYDYEREPGTWA